MNEETLKLLYRIKNTQDGKDFLEHLLNLSNLNYKQWKAEGGDVLRGKAIMIDQLLADFEKCNSYLITKEEPKEWL